MRWGNLKKWFVINLNQYVILRISDANLRGKSIKNTLLVKLIKEVRCKLQGHAYCICHSLVYSSLKCKFVIFVNSYKNKFMFGLALKVSLKTKKLHLPFCFVHPCYIISFHPRSTQGAIRTIMYSNTTALHTWWKCWCDDVNIII